MSNPYNSQIFKTMPLWSQVVQHKIYGSLHTNYSLLIHNLIASLCSSAKALASSTTNAK